MGSVFKFNLLELVLAFSKLFIYNNFLYFSGRHLSVFLCFNIINSLRI